MADATVTVRRKRSSARTNTAASVPVAEMMSVLEQTLTVGPSAAVAFTDLAIPENEANPYNYFFEFEIAGAPAYFSSSENSSDPSGPDSPGEAWAGVTYAAGDIDVMAGTAQGEHPVFKAVS